MYPSFAHVLILPSCVQSAESQPYLKLIDYLLSVLDVKSLLPKAILKNYTEHFLPTYYGSQYEASAVKTSS